MGWFKNRKEIKLARIAAKTERVEARQETKQIAYVNGIDPNAAIAGAISSVAGSAAKIFSPTSGLSQLGEDTQVEKMLKKTEEDQKLENNPNGEGKQNKAIFWVIALAVGYFIAKKLRLI